jgi:purine-nucleoside phosphorylase
MDTPTLAEIEAAARFLSARTSIRPTIGLVLGSGLGSLADEIQGGVDLAGAEIPGWPASTVEGHAGRVRMGTLEGHPVIAQQGRVHYYEGYSMPRIGFPLRVMQQLGAGILIITNAAGAVNPDYRPGELMLLRDHLNLLGMSGHSPLRGPNLEPFGPRFPDMTQAYDRHLLELARQAAVEAGLQVHEGVYVCVAGPSFETPADLRWLRAAGVDAVGMSTVPEVTVARHGGMRVLGISGISNKANLQGDSPPTHAEVLAAGQVIGPRLKAVIQGVLRRL